MKGNFKATNALALIDQTKVAPGQIKKFSDSIATEFGQIARANVETAVRAILVGLGLHAVKGSLKHGEFNAWKKEHLTKGHFWTTTTAMKNASFYMRLAIHILEDVKPTQQELLALTASGDVTLANVTQAGNIRNFVGKLTGFVGERSLNDLLEEYGIKDGSSGGGTHSKAGAIAADDNTLLQDTAEWLLNLRKTVTDVETLKRFTPQHIAELEKQMEATLADLRAAKAQLKQK